MIEPKKFVLLLMFVSKSAIALNNSPLVYPECLNRDIMQDLQQAGAEPWELNAVERLTRHSQRGPVDIVETNCGSASFAHFAPGRLGLNIHWSGDCAIRDPEWYWNTLAILYSDSAGSVTLTAWRRIVGPAVRAALNGGWPRDQIEIVAAMANSSPTEVIEIGQACDWNVVCVIGSWAVNDRRKLRVAN